MVFNGITVVIVIEAGTCLKTCEVLNELLIQITDQGKYSIEKQSRFQKERASS